VFGALIRLILLAAVLAGAGVVALAVVPTPTACTPDVPLSNVSDVFTRWGTFVRGAPPQQVRIDEADATVALQAAIAGTDLPVSDVRVHFCADGKAQLAFTYRIGPVGVHGLAICTLPASSPLRLDIGRIIIGDVPAALTDPLVDRARRFLDPLTALSLTGPIDRVEIGAGALVIFNDR
jgi:hypothetical protein